MTAPDPLDPYVYKAILGRVVDGDTVLLHIDEGFGDWKLGSKYPGGPDAKYPQGRYRLNGINTPELRGPERELAVAAKDRLKELCDSGALFARTSKHGKYRFLVDLFVKREEPTPIGGKGFDVGEEQNHWLPDADLLSLLAQAAPGTTIRALVTEVLSKRGTEIIHINQTLIDEGYAKPYFGGKK